MNISLREILQAAIALLCTVVNINSGAKIGKRNNDTVF